MADVRFGLVLEINGQPIALEPRTAIGDVEKYGVEVGLPAGTEVHLGSVAGGLQGFIARISSALGNPVTVDVPPLPAPFDSAVTYLTTVEVTINDLWIRFPPKADKSRGPDYRIGVYVSGDTIALLGDAIKFKGFAVQIAGTGAAPSPKKK